MLSIVRIKLSWKQEVVVRENFIEVKRTVLWNQADREWENLW
jgi:hypothetical protein